jgi:protein SCO1
LLLLAASCVAMAGLPGCDRLGIGMPASSPTFKGVDVTGADYQFSLPDTEGRLRTPADFRGKVTAVFFGYTQCPDMCPTTMTELAQVKKLLGKDADKLQVVFITVDPERDTPEVLKAYIGHFDPAAVALRGSIEQTQSTAKSFKAFFAKSPGKTPSAYTMDHSTGLYVFDGQARVRLYERHGAGAEALASDVKALLSTVS